MHLMKGYNYLSSMCSHIYSFKSRKTIKNIYTQLIELTFTVNPTTQNKSPSMCNRHAVI